MGITQYYANIKLASCIMQTITHDYVNITDITHFLRIITHKKEGGCVMIKYRGLFAWNHHITQYNFQIRR